ncbi:MAG: hypothetical protein PHI27_13580 [Eubacteriales bacterium]|nr:hypothetical protein [Eubacteriales bacterium]
MIITDRGLDLNFKETKKALGIPTNCNNSKYVYAEDPMFNKIGVSLKNIDYQQYITRFKWNNLPEGLDSELFERIMYFSGSAMFFYIKELNRFYFLPYGMSGEGTQTGIDFYGRFNRLKPYSFNGSTDGSGEKKADGKRISQADLYLSTQIRDNIRDIPMVDNEADAKKIYEEGAVICWDMTPQLAYFVDSRNRISQSYIKYLVQVLIQTKSALINASGFNLFSTNSETENDIMQMQIDAINADREKGKLSAVVSKLLGEITNLQSNSPNAMSDFWSSLVSVDNLRLKSMGIRNDGVIQKSQYQNIQEQSIDINDSMQVYWNSFMERIKFSAIVNSIWGLDIYPEPLLLPGMDQQEDKGEEAIDDPAGGDNTQAQEGTQNA